MRALHQNPRGVGTRHSRPRNSCCSLRASPWHPFSHARPAHHCVASATTPQDTQRAKPADEEEDGFILDHLEEPAAGPASSYLSTAITAEELLEIQQHLLAKAPASKGRGNKQRQVLSSDSEEDDDTASTSGQGQANDSFWDTDRERVFLVGVDIVGRRGGDSSAADEASPSGRGANVRGGKAGSSSNRRPNVRYSIDESLEELERLADTAGLKVVGSTYQTLEIPNNATYIGSGKVAEVARAMRASKAETAIFDCELSPGQLRNLEKSLGGEDGVMRVCDRTALILDIFSQRAATREGKLQVELAQTEYQLPRLTRMWTHLDRVGGGGQVRGAGEKQIELDKRILRDKAASLKKELESVRGHRRAYRERRAVAPIPVVALVGYTNAGKSTLLNRLTDAGVLAEDKLFATLDPTTRRIRTKGNRELLISDTVGFIQKLPTELVAAFRATLEEVQDASVLLHLVDISHPNAAAQCEAVLQVLDDLGVSDIPIVTAWNKIDACANPDQVRKLAARRRDTVCVSGQTGAGVGRLLDLINQKLAESMTQVDVTLPYSAGDFLDDIHKAGELVGEAEYTDTGIHLIARVPAPLAGRLRPYYTHPEDAVAQSDRRVASGYLDGWDGAEAEVHLPTAVSADAANCKEELDCAGLW